MSFKSFLSAFGHDLKKVVDIAVPVERAVQPYLALFVPGIAAGLNLATGAIASTEQKLTAQGAGTGSGPQKLAEVTAIVGPAFTQLLAAEGIRVNDAQMAAIFNGIVAVLNAIPAPSVQAGTTPPPTS
jgi:hypothetical protein